MEDAVAEAVLGVRVCAALKEEVVDALIRLWTVRSTHIVFNIMQTEYFTVVIRCSSPGTPPRPGGTRPCRGAPHSWSSSWAWCWLGREEGKTCLSSAVDRPNICSVSTTVNREVVEPPPGPLPPPSQPTECPLAYVDPALNDDLRQLFVPVGDGQVQPRGPEVLLPLDAVQGGAGKALEQDPRHPGVDERVADDQDVQQRLAC